jgi:DNA-binding CsgD family transcriptional regulator
MPDPLVGRDVELREIHATLPSGSVVVLAPAGVGKSRLAREALAAQERAGAFTAWVQATHSAAALPLGAFAGLLPEGVRAEDTLALLRRGGEVLRARAAGRRIVLGVDDAQLLDPVSAALVLYLAGQDDVRILATIRSGERVPDAIEALAKDAGARRVELGLLDGAAVAELVEAVLDGPAEEPVKRWAQDTSAGNPLYVRELLAGALEAGSLTSASGLWRLLDRPAVSASLRELIATRLADLDDAQREPVELLALAEPLTVDELVALTSLQALVEVEQRELVTVDGGGHVRLAHPLFGEVALPRLRGRRLRLRLAETLQRRVPLRDDDALRIARLLLDAGAEIPRALRLVAARAAILADDPDLAAELAEPAVKEGGLAAPLLLARAHMLRNRVEDAEAVLAAAEPRAPGDPQAYEHVHLRTTILTWGLHRGRESVAAIDRALKWSDDPAWAAQLGLLRLMETAIEDGFSVVDAITPALADPSLAADDRLQLESFAAMSALYAGDVAAAVAIARRIRPSVPLDSIGEMLALATYMLVIMETGDGWPEAERFMVESLRTAVRAGDHQAAGGAALVLGYLELMRGRYDDAARRLAQAKPHFAERDGLGSLVLLAALEVGVAAAVGDHDGVTASLAAIDAALRGRPSHPNQLPFILRARGWAASLRSRAEAIETFLAGAEQLSRSPIFASQLTYEALRAGANVAPLLRELPGPAPLVSAYRAHAEARDAGDGAALLRAAEAFAELGAQRYAMEASAEAAEVFLREGRRDSAQRAAARARELHAPGQGTEPPLIDGLDGTAVALTPREAQIVELARKGLTSPQIADRLVLSARTVEAHLYRGMSKLGVTDRRQL